MKKRQKMKARDRSAAMVNRIEKSQCDTHEHKKHTVHDESSNWKNNIVRICMCIVVW